MIRLGACSLQVQELPRILLVKWHLPISGPFSQVHPGEAWMRGPGRVYLVHREHGPTGSNIRRLLERTGVLCGQNRCLEDVFRRAASVGRFVNFRFKIIQQ